MRGEMMEAANRITLNMDPTFQRRLRTAAALKGVSIGQYCRAAIGKELAKDEADGVGEPSARRFSFARLEESRDKILGDRVFPGNSVDLLREAREIRDEQASRRGIDRQAFERAVKRREEIFKGKPLPGDSVDFIREAREIRNAQMDKW